MSAYAWVITVDLIDAGAANGTIGPSGTMKTRANIVLDPNVKRFRLLDGDGEVYYLGFIANEDSGFEPLDDFGTPNAGCTSIEYFEGNKWRAL